MAFFCEREATPFTLPTLISKSVDLKIVLEFVFKQLLDDSSRDAFHKKRFFGMSLKRKTVYKDKKNKKMESIKLI